MTGPVQPIPRPDVPEGVPTPLSEVRLPPTDEHGAYDPVKRDPAGWYVKAMRAVHTALVMQECDERTRFVVMRALAEEAVHEERMLLLAGAVFDPTLNTIAREMGDIA